MASNKSPAPAGLIIPTVADIAEPEGGQAIGEAFLYRPGPMRHEGGDGEPGTKKNKKGVDVLHCGWRALRGWLVEIVGRDDGGHGFGAFDQIVIRLTEPGLGIQNDQFVEVKAGQCVVVTESGHLKDVAKYAENATQTGEVWIKPTGGFIATKRGQMREWKRKLMAVEKRSVLQLPLMVRLPDDLDGEGDLPPQLRGNLGAPPALPARS